jgi:hypothetical protein
MLLGMRPARSAGSRDRRVLGTSPGTSPEERRHQAMEHIVESGTEVLRPVHPHNGYYAGDFSSVPFQEPDLQFLTTMKEYAA